MSELTAKDLHWFHLANCNGTQEFYLFKDRFLKRFGTFDGFDRQKIKRMCHTCSGSGWYADEVRCMRCTHGVYDIAEHWLQRWILGGKVYHKPLTHAEVYHFEGAWKYPEPKNEIEGRITHDPTVTQQASRRAYYRLLLRHEPMNFYWAMINQMKQSGKNCRMKWTFCLIRLRNKLDLFKSVPENDEVPF